MKCHIIRCFVINNEPDINLNDKRFMQNNICQIKKISHYNVVFFVLQWHIYKSLHLFMHVKSISVPYLSLCIRRVKEKIFMAGLAGQFNEP